MPATPLLDTLKHIAQHCWRGGIWLKEAGKSPRHVKIPLAYQHLFDHLDGTGPAVGLAPIVPGTGVTRIAVLDLDDHAKVMPFEDMCSRAASIVEQLVQRGYAPSIFRSSGGRGIHIYLFWEAPVPAADVRQFLAEVLEYEGYKVGTKGVDKGEIEVFPKQDRVPADGAGNMFVLPFSRHSVQMTYEDLLGVEAFV